MLCFRVLIREKSEEATLHFSFTERRVRALVYYFGFSCLRYRKNFLYWRPETAGDGSFCALTGKGAHARHGGVGAVVLLMAVLVVCWSLGGGWYGGGEGGQWTSVETCILLPHGMVGEAGPLLGMVALLPCSAGAGHWLLCLAWQLEEQRVDTGSRSSLSLWKGL